MWKSRYDFYIGCIRQPQFLRVVFYTLRVVLYAGIYGIDKKFCTVYVKYGVRLILK